jgi:hypothetical protein
VEDLEADFGTVVEELEIGFDGVEVRGRDGRGGPEEGIVVGEEGEEEAEEEGGCCGRTPLAACCCCDGGGKEGRLGVVWAAR